MSLGYQLSPQALSDLEEIISGCANHSGEDCAYRLEDDLLSAFEKLARMPGLGHRRSDLTHRAYCFYAVIPYLIVYARGIDPLAIVGIFHGSRNVRNLLKKRSV